MSHGSCVMSHIETLQKEIFCQVHQLLDADYTHKTHKLLNELTDEIARLILVLQDLKNTCQIAQKRITEDLSICDVVQNDKFKNQTNDVLIQHTAGGMIMYPGRVLSPMYTTIQTPAGLPLTALHIDQMQNIPSALYYYNGTEYPHGFYMRVGVAIVQVPWAPIYHASPYPPCARCKYQTKALCDEHRNKASTVYKVPQKKCYYAHQGDQLPRVVHQSRCPSLPNFGTAEPTYNKNHNLTINDIKSLLFHGVSDIACAALAIESKKQSIVLINIDKV